MVRYAKKEGSEPAINDTLPIPSDFKQVAAIGA